MIVRENIEDDLRRDILATTMDHIPLKHILPSSLNSESKNKTNSRSGSDYTPTMQTKMDHRLQSNTDSSITRSQDSGIVPKRFFSP